MNYFLRIIAVISVSLLFVSDSISAPLNGTYSIGTSGDYTTTTSAFTDASAQGVSGPVVFQVMNGTYNENLVISGIPGSSTINTVTLTSMSGNRNDVTVSIVSISADYIIIDKITILGNILLGGNNLTFSNNKFFNGGLHKGGFPDIDMVTISNNEIAGEIDFQGDNFAGISENLIISSNIISGDINLVYFGGFVIEKNYCRSVSSVYGGGTIVKNKIYGDLYSNSDIINNFIYGKANVAYKFIYNTIVGGNDSVPTLNLIGYAGDIVMNNIIINPEGGLAFFSYNNVPISDYNDFYNGGNSNLISSGGINFNTVSQYTYFTGLDSHSNSVPVNFVSPVDLHISLASAGNPDLLGTPIAYITEDIDDQTRSITYPYKGADEVVDFPLPIELASFVSSINGRNVDLNWVTASETNNAGFDIERAVYNGQLTIDNWSRIGNVNGNGTSAISHSYSFTDRNLASGKYSYRLKQIDFNGNFKYFNLSNEINIGVPLNYSLSQNYPNPFNPSTNLEFEIPELGFVSLKVYNALGKEVATIVNEVLSPGSYNYQFSTVNYQLPSGVYFYRLESGGFVETKRMVLLK